MKRKVDVSKPKRTFSIKTVYFHGKKVVQVNKACHANSAVLRCVDHMQHNHYKSNVAEVFDELSGELHAVISRSMATGVIKIVFRREVQEGA